MHKSKTTGQSNTAMPDKIALKGGDKKMSYTQLLGQFDRRTGSEGRQHPAADCILVCTVTAISSAN